MSFEHETAADRAHRYRALRAALAYGGTTTDRIEAGIDAARSDEYHAAVEAVHDAREAQADRRMAALGLGRMPIVRMLPPNVVYPLSQAMSDRPWDREHARACAEIPLPKVERVPGATALRTWLASELTRIASIRGARNARRPKPTRPLRDRMLSRVRAEVASAYRDCRYRRSKSSWAGGKHALAIDVVTRPTAGAASGSTETVWSDNRKWSGTNSSHDITVSWAWLRDVRARGIAVVGGMLTLSAQPIDGLRPDETAVYARWVQQGRGCALVTRDGVLYHDASGWHHAGTLQGARRDAKARAREAMERRQRREKELLDVSHEIESLHGLVIRRDQIPTSVACTAGVEDWIAKRGLPPETQEIDAGELLRTAVQAGDRVDFVRRIIAFFRHKQAA